MPFTLSEMVFFTGQFKSKTRTTIQIPFRPTLHYSITPSLNDSTAPSLRLFI
jgi:hypothetical protein